MKQSIKWLIVLFAVVLISCNKYDPHDTDRRVGISTITHYVVLTLKGDPFQSVVQNGSFTDSGATAFENGTAVAYSVSGSIDFTSLGIYTLTYSAVNKDGYTSSITRKVAVIPGPELPGVDLSGSYNNVGAASLTASIKKLAPGVYFTSNCWGGASEAVIPAYFLCSDGVNITVFYQNYSIYGNLDGAGTFDAGLITWTITLEDQGPFTDTKSWQKQ